ncbi:MAG TPA: flavodoxin/nitric oxide synthase [Cellulomonas sp.]|uniref:flavodoxin family protein n=1 Tax=Cellulomonas sp. TaxID=40001 RepID=UPI002E33F335|nr:flavodoxin/nitric oxide synthase [Cellulomonas sp.]HEX5332511.1 flavodoxin/nitric oxide synthase [Cellulomonas sp.]
MRAVVVVESMFGNTRQIAEAIADGLRPAVEAEVVDVGAAPEVIDPDVGLLVVGGPTHAFGMSRPTSRAQALQEAGTHDGSPDVGMREWLEHLDPVGPGVLTATFDTRMKSRWAGSAAASASKLLRRRGVQTLAPSHSFVVTDKPGPLAPGELDRARAWGAELARLAGTPAAGV